MGLLSTKKSTSTAVTIASDLRTAVEGNTGLVVGPKGTYSEGGALTVGTGDYSPTSLNLVGANFRTGMSGKEVRGLLGEQSALFGQQLSSVTDFGTAAFSAVNAARAKEIQAETGTGVDWKQLAPLIVLGAIIAWAAKRRKA